VALVIAWTRATLPVSICSAWLVSWERKGLFGTEIWPEKGSPLRYFEWIWGFK
jgi:hypothetical protein